MLRHAKVRRKVGFRRAGDGIANEYVEVAGFTGTVRELPADSSPERSAGPLMRIAAPPAKGTRKAHRMTSDSASARSRTWNGPRSWRRDATDFGTFGLTVGFDRAVALVRGILIARFAGPEVFGQFTAFIVILALVESVGQAIDVAFIRRAGKLSGPDDITCERGRHLVAKLYLAALALVMGLSVPFLCGGLGSAPGSAFANFGGAVITGGLVVIYRTLAAHYRQQKRFIAAALLVPALNVTTTIAIAVLIVVEVPLDQAKLTGVFSALSLALAIVAGASIVRGLGRPIRPSRAGVIAYVKDGAPLMGAAAVNTIASRLDVYFLAAYATFDALGFYGAGIRIATSLAVIVSALGLVILPHAPSALQSRSEIRRYAGIAGLSYLIVVLVAGPLYLLAEPVIVLAFGGAYRAASAITSVLIIQFAFAAFSLPLRSIVQCHRPTTVVFAVSLIQLASSAALLSFLTPSYGALGAAWAVTLASGLILVVYAVLVLHLVRGHRRAWRD